MDAQLLMGLAQRGVDCGFAGIDLAAWEGDLSRVRTHVRGAVDQQEARSLALGNRDENRCCAQLVRREFRLIMQIVQFPRMAPRMEALEACGQKAHVGTSANRAP